MRFKAAATLALIAATAALAGLIAWLPAGVIDRAVRPLRPAQALVGGVPRREVGCPAGSPSRRFVALTFGQSNAANDVQGRHASVPRVIHFHEGRCYAGKDPLPGATGNQGSVWSRLGDLLITAGAYDEVVLVGIAVSSSEVARWSAGGDLHARLLDALAQMKAHGLEPTHLLWHQGETDAKAQTSAEAYRRHFLSMMGSVRARGFDTPVFVAGASYCHGRSSAAVRAAQASLPDAASGIHGGPDTDLLVGPQWRHDDCHFNAAGAARHAELWRDILLRPSSRS